jgi:DNA excision repair protein ERCC-4
MHIYQDTREKKPYSFSKFDCSVTEQELVTGDYCIKGDGGMDGNSFDPLFAIERKGESDFLKSITWERDRFERELERADSFAHRMPIVVEQTQEYFMEDRHYPDVHPNSIEATIESHPSQYYVDYYFCRDRRRAAQLTFEWLEWRERMLD